MDLLLGGLGALLAAGLAAGAWLLGRRISKRLGKGAGETAAGGALLATVALVFAVDRMPASLPEWFWDSPLVYFEFAYFLPTGALFFGIAAGRVDTPEKTRALRALAILLGAYAALHVFLAIDARRHPLLEAVPPAGPVQAQTTGWSCGPAACVTLLKAHGIESTEREMGELCLTYAGRGTTLPRFLRGLTRKLEAVGSPLRVRAEDGLTPESLAAFPGPCLVGLKLNPVLGHAAVLFRREPDGRYLMGDPLDGRPVLYEAEEFEKRFTGEAIALE